MNTAHSGSLKRIGKVVVIGPFIGGLPFNLVIIIVPFSYAMGVIPAFLTGICAEIWLQARQNLGKPVRTIHLVLLGCILGFSTCLITSLIYVLNIQGLDWNLFDWQAENMDPIRLAFIFSLMGAFWSSVLLPVLYRSVVSKKT